MLLFAVFGSIIAMIFNVDFKMLPQNQHIIQISKCCIILPTVFMSFGFQGSLHSLTKFCNNDRNLIKMHAYMEVLYQQSYTLHGRLE